MKSIAQTKFWQLPLDIKLVVIVLFLLGLYSFWSTGVYIETKGTLELGSLIRGIIECGLAIGLINRNNESRSWTAFFVFLGSLGGLFSLAILLFDDPNPTVGFQFSYEKLTRTQTIVFLVMYLILNVGILFTLLRPKTKAFFSLQTSEKDNQP